MALTLNLCGNGGLVPSGGYPVRLWPGGEIEAVGFVPLAVVSVIATVRAESGTADVHLALYEPPTTVGGADGSLVVDLDPDDESVIVKSYRADVTALGLTSQTLAVAVPTNRQRQSYVVRLWVDNVTGRIADSVDRDGDEDTDDEPLIPTGVVLESMSVT